jgi:DNA-binding GntR family transcriptional regulator
MFGVRLHVYHAPMAPERHLTKTEIALQEVRERLRTGSLQPGQRVRVEPLTHELSMSQTPIREALRLLQADGLVEYRPHYGIVVAEISVEATAEVYRLRALLEPFAVELAVAKLTPEGLQELEQLHRQLIAAARKDSLTFSDHNHAWHWALYQASQSPLLNDFIRRLWDAFPWRSMWAITGRTELTLQEHTAIMDAVREGDPERAPSLMRDHILSGRSTVLGQLQDLTTLEPETLVGVAP